MNVPSKEALKDKISEQESKISEQETKIIELKAKINEQETEINEMKTKIKYYEEIIKEDPNKSRLQRTTADALKTAKIEEIVTKLENNAPMVDQAPPIRMDTRRPMRSRRGKRRIKDNGQGTLVD